MKAIEELRELVKMEKAEDRVMELSTWLRRNTMSLGVSMSIPPEVSGGAKQTKYADQKSSEIKRAVKTLAEQVIEESIHVTDYDNRLSMELLFIRDSK